jgi:autotransporter-associated beta strand protein
MGGQNTANICDFQIGRKNLNTVFSGVINDGTLTTGVNPSRAKVTKVGNGTLTLSGVSTYTSSTLVNDGTLLVDGSLTATDLVTVNAANAANGTLGGTLGGAGSIAGPVSVTGVLRPNPTGLRNGTLALGSSLDLSVINAETSTVTANTRFDFGGTTAHRVVGISVAGALTYGGTLEIAIPGTTFNGTYALFAPAGAPSGSFASINVLGAADAVVATLVDDGFGVFTGTNGAISYSFTPATGSLTLAGAATPAGIPSARVLSGTAGNGTASLSWNASSGATYDVYRSLTSGTGQVLVADDISTASYADSGLTNGTPYFYTVTASNDAGTSLVSNELTLTPTALSAREAWRQNYFPGSTATTGPGADTNDHDGDGRVNLLEYAVGSDPTVANTGPGYALDTVGGQLRLTFNRIDDPALTYTVTGRNDLITGVWSAIVPVAGNNPITGFTGTVPGVLETESVNVIDPVVLGTGNPRRFLRLEVSY